MIAVSQSILESLAPIVRPAGALGGGALSPYGRRRPFISLRSELAGDSAHERRAYLSVAHARCSTPNPSASARTNT